ncbi:helix-turn-helix transcriptional regulator [Roseovarius confluentis]|uniref:helix-turn-helix transcriptional regulator n=1 Tax=Roseovarius confluentis TaxID=1852027 RepID=UPI000CDE0A7D|nr:AlpA family transcriptional regulator [Roseovarius confluentis]
MTDKILRCREVQQAIGLSRSTIYRMIERGDFPRPQKLGLRAIGWRQSAIDGWLNARAVGIMNGMDRNLHSGAMA